MSRKQNEWQLQCAVAEYLKVQYPDVLFYSVPAGLSLDARQAVRAQKTQKPGFSMPDMVIFAARRGFNGMFLELKTESPFRKDGTLKVMTRYRKINGMRVAYDHLAEQDASAFALSAEHYFGGFFWDFDHIKQSIDCYLKG